MIASCNKNYLQTKINTNVNEVTDFYEKKIPTLDSHHTCLAVLSLDSALKKDDSCFLQVFFKECKYIEKKVIRGKNENLSDI